MQPAATHQPSVQLYSVRDAIDADLDRALARIAEIGYEQVEPYAFVASADALRRALPAHGLAAPSAHNGVVDEADPARVFGVAAELGIGTVIDPAVRADRWQRADDVHRLADRMNELAQAAAAAGVAVGYHNHQWELASRIDGRHALEVLADALDPAVVLEIDTYWALVGGADAPALLRGLGERVRFLHIKDGSELGDDDTKQVAAGQGVVDVPAILAAAPGAVRVVEFDDCAGDVFEGIADSLAYLRDHEVHNSEEPQ